MAEASEPSKQRRRSSPSLITRFTLIVPLAAVAAFLTIILSFWHLPQVQFGLQGKARAITILTAEAASTDTILAKEAAIGGITTLQADPALPVPPDSDSSLTFLGSTARPISLVKADLPAWWTLKIVTSADDALMLTARRSVHASPENPLVQYMLPAGTMVRFDADGDSKNVVLAVDTSITATARYLDLRLAHVAPDASLFTMIRPGQIGFEQLLQAANDQGDKQLAFGTIEDGTLWLRHGASAAPIGLIDRLSMTDISASVVRPLSLKEGMLRFGVRGTASGITNTPAQSDTIDLRPTVLDYLVDNGLIKILIAVISFFVSLELANLVRKR